MSLLSRVQNQESKIDKRDKNAISSRCESKPMITEYIEAELARATYEIIQYEEPYYREIPRLQRVWPSGKTLEECRSNLAETVKDWVLLSIAKGLPIPALGGVSVHLPKKVTAYM